MPVRNPRPLIIGAALVLTSGLLPAATDAKPAANASEKAPPTSPKPPLDLASLERALESGDEAKSLAALDTIAGSGEPSGAKPVEALLTRGANMAVTSRAIDTLGRLAQPSSAVALTPYAQHRSLELRRAALRALIATKAPQAGDVLRRALHGSDAAQRAIAARGLGELGVRAAVPELFVVLSKDVPEAARALGQLCVAAECEKFAGLLGRLRFEVMESGMVPVLLRSQVDVSDELKLKLVERLRRMATEPARRLLQTALATLPSDASPKLKQGLERALKGYSVGEEVSP